MTYIANTEKPTEQSRTFVILRPKRRVTGWAVHSGNIWVADFDYGDVDKVFFDGERAVEGQLVPTIGPVLNADEWVYDRSEQKLYIHKTTDPDDNWAVAFYDIRISTEAGQWYEDPVDDTSREVFYEGAMIETPRWRQEQSDVLFGFFPVSVASLNIANALSLFNRHVHDSSWNLGEILVYQMLGDEDTDNCRLIFRGYTKNLSWTNSVVQIGVESIFKILETRSVFQKNVTLADFPTLDTEALIDVWPIRKVYGRVEGFSPINADYDPINPADTTNNRSWLVSQGQSGLAELTKNIDPGGTNDSTHTTFTDVSGLVVGDSIRVSDIVNGGTIITAINSTTKVVTHEPVGARGVLVGATAFRSWLGHVKIRADGILYTVPQHFWSTTLMASNTKGFTMVDNFEASLPGFPSPFNPDEHEIFCRVYGETTIINYAVGGTPITTVNTVGGNLNNIAAIIYQTLREIPNYDSEAFDEDSFAAAIAGRDSLIGYCIPVSKTQRTFPTYQEIILDLLTSGLMRLQINDFNGAAIGISLIEPLAGTADNTVNSGNMSQFKHEISYDDVYSSVDVDFDIGDVNYGAFPNRPASKNTTPQEQAAAIFLHEIDRPFEIDSYIISPITETDPLGFAKGVEYARRVGSILGERRGRVSFSGRNDFILAELGETYQVDREQLPGYDFEEGTTRSRKYALVESDKGPSETSIVLDDQKGIEDNTSLW